MACEVKNARKCVWHTRNVWDLESLYHNYSFKLPRYRGQIHVSSAEVCRRDVDLGLLAGNILKRQTWFSTVPVKHLHNTRSRRSIIIQDVANFEGKINEIVEKKHFMHDKAFHSSDFPIVIEAGFSWIMEEVWIVRYGVFIYLKMVLKIG